MEFPQYYPPSLYDTSLKIQFAVHEHIEWFFWFTQSFLGSPLGLFLVVSTHMFFWNWYFVLDFHFCRVLPVCCHATLHKVCASNTAWSSCWDGPWCKCLWFWARGLGYSLHVMGFTPGAPWWASYEGTTALSHVPTCPCPSQPFGTPPLKVPPLHPQKTCQGFHWSLVKWGSLKLSFYFPIN